MKLNILLIMLLVSCSSGIDRIPDSHNLKTDVDLFLSTTDPDVEIKILQRLKSAKVSHESVKGLPLYASVADREPSEGECGGNESERISDRLTTVTVSPGAGQTHHNQEHTQTH